MAAVVRVKHVHKIAGKWRWIPAPWMRKLGATSETLGLQLEASELARAVALNELWESSKQAKETAQPGTVAWLIKDYEQSSWYASLKPRTRENADLALQRIHTALGHFRAAHVGRKDCRTCYEGILAKHGPNAAKTAHTYLRVLFSWAQEQEIRADNPAKGMKVQTPDPRKQTWTHEQVQAVIKKAQELGMPDIALLVMLGYDTGQRLTDLMDLKWSAYDGEGLNFDQNKTRKDVWVPLDPQTIKTLSQTKREAVQIVVASNTGQPYTNRALVNRRFREAADKAGLPKQIQMRDLRRTVATEISAGGGKIHPITGHAPGSSMERVYVVPNKEAARTSKRARNKNKV